MAYNLGRTFKDVLKIISLGVMATINGVSGDVFAFEGEDRARGAFNRRSALDLQGSGDPETLLKMALVLSLGPDNLHHVPVEARANLDDQGAHPQRAAAEDDEDWKLAVALQFKEEGHAHPRRAAAAAEDVVGEGDGDFAFALELQERLNAGILDQGAHPRGAAADDEDKNYALALKFQEELNAGILDQGAHPRGAAAAVIKAKDWTVDPSALSHQHWEKHQIEGEGFGQYILRQSVLVYDNLREQRREYPIHEALPEIALRLKEINTGLGVSEKIDDILRENF